MCYKDRKEKETCTENICVTTQKAYCLKERVPFEKKYKNVAKFDRNNKNDYKKRIDKTPPPAAYLP